MAETAATYAEQLLAEFVDREDEMARFVRMLEDKTRGLLVIWGDGGVGKSSLQAKMKHELARRTLRKAEIVWTDTYGHDYLAIMRKLRDDLGVGHFKPFTDLVNFFTVPEYRLTVNLEGAGKVSVLEGARIEGSTVGDVAGIVIKDLMLVAPRADKEIPEAERLTRLTATFVPCLAAATATQPCVVFFDAVEKMTADTERWIWGELLGRCRDGQLPNVKFVLCGRKEPQLDRTWSRACEVKQLRPLEREHIVAYLEKRGIVEGREALADLLVVVSHGNLLNLATYVDGYLNLQQSRKND
ncbi:MAG: AAA family ATPase [Dongiaceae bacterium]